MRVNGYLSRRYNGLYMLTRKKPVICPVDHAGHTDLYPAHGDALYVNNLCVWSAKYVFGVEDLPVLDSVPVFIDGGIREGTA